MRAAWSGSTATPVPNVMPAGRGRLGISVSRQMQKDAGRAIGDVTDFEVTSIGRG